MASGHVNRAQRPNTWLHRPSLRREDSSCQPGAVHTWHIATFRWSAELRRYQKRADIAQLAAGSTRSRMTQLGHSAPDISVPLNNSVFSVGDRVGYGCWS
jgi:hypothetical protein